MHLQKNLPPEIEYYEEILGRLAMDQKERAHRV